jgi:hypothetical protein
MKPMSKASRLSNKALGNQNYDRLLSSFDLNLNLRRYVAAWSHPVQLSLRTTSVQGWPKLVFAVYERDAWMGTDAFVSYGIVALPLAVGTDGWCSPREHICFEPAFVELNGIP